MNELKLQIEEVLEVLNTEYDGAPFTEYVNSIYEDMLEDEKHIAYRYAKLLLEMTEHIDADRG